MIDFKLLDDFLGTKNLNELVWANIMMNKNSYQILLIVFFVIFFTLSIINARELDLVTILGSIIIASIESLILYLITSLFIYVYNRSKVKLD
jgi:hypothetical protein